MEDEAEDAGEAVPGTGRLVVGCAVWGYAGWKGSLYPTTARSGELLALYASRFGAVEGNTTFYAVPTEETVARWAAQVADGFRFFPKLPRDVTHELELAPGTPQAQAFLERMRGLGEHLGPLFAQMPATYVPAQLDDLRAFLTGWPDDAPLCVELRHPAWYEEPHRTLVRDLLVERGIARTILDTRPVYSTPDDPQVETKRRKPRLPCQPEATANHVMVRFVGHPRQEVNAPFLAEWAGRVTSWLEEGRDVAFFAHCPEEEQSPVIASELQRLVHERGAAVDEPEDGPIAAAPPPVAQLDLF